MKITIRWTIQDKDGLIEELTVSQRCFFFMAPRVARRIARFMSLVRRHSGR